MPRARFENLDADKRNTIYEVAARAFAEHGYEGASLNQILGDAGLSKGAAYYYFEDKLDFYISTVIHYVELLLGEVTFSVNNLTPETFWSDIKQLYIGSLVKTHREPWIFKLVQTAWRLPSEQRQSNEKLDKYIAVLEERTKGLLVYGQEHGLVREDLPHSLLVALVFGLDIAADEWFMEHWDELDETQVATLAHKIADTMERMLRPT